MAPAFDDMLPAPRSNAATTPPKFDGRSPESGRGVPAPKTDAAASGPRTGDTPPESGAMPAPVILVLLDGLSAAVGHACMGYLEALVEAGIARSGDIPCELPALSRPLYHCILTGRTPARSGVVHNTVRRPDPTPTVFHSARDAGLVTAAAAYHWMSELCNRSPWDPVRDRCTDDPSLAIMHGLFYSNDAYPDDHVFMDAEALRVRHAPHLLLVHPMGVDDAGHRHGGDSAAYRNAARAADMLLAAYMPRWLDEGCRVVVISDHGMHPDGRHNGTTERERLTPVWLAGEGFGPDALPRRQTEWRGLLAGLLGLEALQKRNS